MIAASQAISGRSRGRAAPRSASCRPRSARAGPGSPSSPPPRPWPWSARTRRRRRRGGRPRPARRPGAGRWCAGPSRARWTAAVRPAGRGSPPAPPSPPGPAGAGTRPSRHRRRVGTGRAVLEPVLPALELPQVPVLRDQRAGAAPGSGAGPSASASATNPSSTVPGTPGSAAAAACPSRPARPRRCGPAPGPPGPPRAAARCRLGDRHGHLHQRGRAAGAVGVAPVADPPGRRRGVGGPDVPAGQRPRPAPRPARARPALQLVQLGEHRPQPVRPGLVQPAQQRTQHRRPAATAAQSASKQVPSMNPT